MGVIIERYESQTPTFSTVSEASLCHKIPLFYRKILHDGFFHHTTISGVTSAVLWEHVEFVVFPLVTLG